jgi:hypothetical protein
LYRGMHIIFHNEQIPFPFIELVIITYIYTTNCFYVLLMFHTDVQYVGITEIITAINII